MGARKGRSFFHGGAVMWCGYQGMWSMLDAEELREAHESWPPALPITSAPEDAPGLGF